MPPDAYIVVIDDDPSIRRALERLLALEGYGVTTFASAEDFLRAALPVDRPGCLLVDIRMPGMSGLDLQKVLRQRGLDLPLIFLTGFGTIPMSVQAMKRGAFDFLEKPFDSSQLLATVKRGIDLGRRLMAAATDQQRLAAKIGLLTARELEVLEGMTRGLLNKQIGAELGISEKTVKVHRANIKAKLAISSLTELGRLYGSYLEQQGDRAQSSGPETAA